VTTYSTSYKVWISRRAKSYTWISPFIFIQQLRLNESLLKLFLAIVDTRKSYLYRIELKFLHMRVWVYQIRRLLASSNIRQKRFPLLYDWMPYEIKGKRAYTLVDPLHYQTSIDEISYILFKVIRRLLMLYTRSKLGSLFIRILSINCLRKKAFLSS
jgi:hypothetical protein